MKKILLLLILNLGITVLGQMTPTMVVNIPMRDGKNLAADIYIPNNLTNGSVVLIQTPYNKNLFRNSLPLGIHQNLNSSPFIWVVVDWRGFYGSQSASVSQPNRGQDGYDVIDWIVSQNWSNGKVGTWGPSALGGVQYSTAKEQHPNHLCAVPLVAHPQQSYDTYFYGGVLEKSRLQQLDALGYGLSPIILSNPYYSMVWQYSESTTWYPSAITIPTLQIGGWYDHNVDKMLEWYEAVRAQADISVRENQWLLMGPWVHGGTGSAYVGSSLQGELDYPNAAFKSDTMALDFLKFYLNDEANGWENTSKVTYYNLGKNEWKYTDFSTFENTSNTVLFLNQNQSLNQQIGSGSSSFISDPRNPSPTLGGPTLSSGLDQGPYDQISLENRSDVIVFETTELNEDFFISGEIIANLNVQCNQPDADIAIRIVDVYPDGRNMLINDGIKRLRFRNGNTISDESFLQSDQIYTIQIETPHTVYTWKAGHKIKIFISGNNSTRWDVNLQNGGTMYQAGDTNIANIQIHHSVTFPSSITLKGGDLSLKINKISKENGIVIFPNPITNKLNLSHNIEEYKIYNLEGRIIEESNLFFQNEIDVSNMKNGFYTIQIKGMDGKFSILKFQKN